MGEVVDQAVHREALCDAFKQRNPAFVAGLEGRTGITLRQAFREHVNRLMREERSREVPAATAA